MKSLYQKLILIIFILSVFIIVSCSTPSNTGDSSSGGNTKTVYSGENVVVSGNVTLPSLSPSIMLSSSLSNSISYAEVASSNYKILAIYHDGGGFYDFDYEVIDIDIDGNFAFNVQKGKSFIAFLIENSAEKYEVVGIIGIKINGSVYWEDIQTDYINGNIDLGSISSSPIADSIVIEGNDLNDAGVVITDFSDEISRNACIDDVVRFFKNLINNYKGNEDHPFSSYPAYAFLHTVRNAVLNDWASVDNVEKSGYQIYLFGEDIGDTPKLYPPSIVSQGNYPATTYSPEVPIPAGYKNSGYDRVCYNFITGDTKEQLLQGNPPSGAWILEHSNGSEVCQFDYNCALPMRDGNISVPIPIIRVNTSDVAEDIIDSIQIRWFLLDKNGDFEELSHNYVNRKIDYVGLEFADFTNLGDNREHIDNLSFSDDKKFIPTEKWYFKTVISADGHYADYIGVYYTINDIGYRFVCRTPY